MRGNSFGKLLSITSFGESHGKAMGVVIDGMPGGIEINLAHLQAELDRRKPGQNAINSTRAENDQAIILSGIFQNKTLGSPIAVMVENHDQRSEDYQKLSDEYRVGHADKTTELKFGIRDYRGGGRASGRETLARVIGGYFAGLIVPQLKTRAYVEKIGDFFEIAKSFDPHSIHAIDHLGPFGVPESDKWQQIESKLSHLKQSGDSVGGVMVVSLTNVMPGLGEPCFDKLKADLAKAFTSIGACIGVSFGLGFELANLKGSEYQNYPQYFGGIEGGISSGENILIRLAFKAPSTVGTHAKKGRHDVCLLPRAIPVVEAMAKLVVADHFLRQNAYQLGRT
jgi:chorismate synthase